MPLEIPTIRIEVERMKYQIIHAFAQHNDELEKMVETELTKVFANYPFEETIRHEAYGVITQAIERSMKEFFVYGDGYKTIQAIVNQVIQESIKK